MFRILPFLMLPLLGMAQTNSKMEMPMGENTTSEKQSLEIKRNAFYNLEELKVRWKKAALENCPGVPCVTVTVPGSPTIVNVVAGNAQAMVSFTAPSSTGGSAITSYTVTSTPVGGTGGSGTGSPITVTGLSNGTSYTFTVIATNAVGNSVTSAASTAVAPSAPFLCGTSTVPDNEGNTYNTVSIGTQCWTKENLRVRRYSDGTEIRFDKSGTTAGTVSQTWSGTGLNYGAYTLYEHDSVATPSSNLINYGYLYNWYAVKGIITDGGTSTKNICPTGWHVPTDTDWTDLTAYLGGEINAGGKMKSTGDNSAGTGLWSSPNTGADNTSSSGFSALPGGNRSSGGRFYNIRNNAFFWSATEDGNGNAWFRYLSYYNRDVNRYGSGDSNSRKSTGASVRCLRD